MLGWCDVIYLDRNPASLLLPLDVLYMPNSPHVYAVTIETLIYWKLCINYKPAIRIIANITVRVAVVIKN